MFTVHDSQFTVLDSQRERERGGREGGKEGERQRERERETDRHRGEKGRGKARGETDIGRREGAQRQERALGHRERVGGRGGEGKGGEERGGEGRGGGRGGEGVQCSLFTVHDSQFTVHGICVTVEPSEDNAGH